MIPELLIAMSNVQCPMSNVQCPMCFVRYSVVKAREMLLQASADEHERLIHRSNRCGFV